MNPVNGIGQLVQILRQRVSGRTASLTQKKPTSSNATSAHESTRKKPSLAETERKISARIKVLSEDEARGPKGALLFVESIVAREFGDQLLHDSQFNEIATDIVDTLSENPAVWKKMQTLLTNLWRS